MDSPFALPVELTPFANNREQALKRAKSFDLGLKRDSNKQQHALEFMQKMFDNGHAEIASPVDEKTEHWYLPLFSIYHQKNPDSVRVVFDSAVKFHSSSLNDVLMKGTPLHNSLLGILLRFRTEAIAITVCGTNVLQLLCVRRTQELLMVHMA